MDDASVDSLRAELALLAARFVLPGLGPDVNRALRPVFERCPLSAWDRVTAVVHDDAVIIGANGGSQLSRG